ncbi:MAG: hypothetical protein EBZ77_03770 [Chitinophagia bacterium]|nr:hypothetical protein [Chitinophagia bacterium]
MNNRRNIPLLTVAARGREAALWARHSGKHRRTLVLRKFIIGKRKLCTKQINVVRTIITATGTDIQLNIAPEYVGKRIEITYLALDELQNNRPIPDQSLSSLWNSLNDDAAQQLRDAVDKVRSEWE